MILLIWKAKTKKGKRKRSFCDPEKKKLYCHIYYIPGNTRFNRRSERPMRRRLPTLGLLPLLDFTWIFSLCHRRALSATWVYPLSSIDLGLALFPFQVIDIATLFEAVGRLSRAADDVGELQSSTRCQSLWFFKATCASGSLF